MRSDDDKLAEQEKRFTDTLMTEYEVLKKEQDRRMATRDTIPYWTIGVVLLLAGAAVKNPAALLAVAPVCAVLGWIRISNDHKVTQIRKHIVSDIAPALTALCGNRPVFTWETAHREARKTGMKALNVFIEVLLFVLPGFGAAVAFHVTSHHPFPLWLAGAADIVLSGVIAVQIFTHVDFDRRTR